jgi:uncharacterized SAM-binding protein YcdF (DUF218 family)
MIRAARSLLPEVGLALGLFVALNVAGELLRPGFDQTGAWIDLPPGTATLAFKAALAGLLLAHGWAPLVRVGRVAGVVALAVVAAAAVRDAAIYFALIAEGRISTALPVPGSLLVLAVSLALAGEIARPAPRRPRDGWWLARCVAVGSAVAVVLPLVLMLTFGPTRYVRDADCIVVFGARVYSDGTPSEALADRVDEAIRLYHRGVAPIVVMSGALDEVHGGSEPAAMRARAIAAGVPAAAIVIDEAGIDTASTVDNTVAWLRARGGSRVLAVSHYYHQPRVKLLFERAGVRTFTVPATMHRRLLKEPYFIAREVLAYYRALFLL